MGSNVPAGLASPAGGAGAGGASSRRRGRPSKFTEARAEQILWLVRHGFDDRYAAREVGISRATLYRWLDNPSPEFAAFRKSMLQAEAEAEAAVTVNIVRTSQRDWRAGVTWLRATHPERWNRTGRTRRSRKRTRSRKL